MKLEATFDNEYGEKLTLIWDTTLGKVECHHDDIHEAGIFIDLNKLNNVLNEGEAMFINSLLDIWGKIHSSAPSYFKLKEYSKKSSFATILQMAKEIVDNGEIPAFTSDGNVIGVKESDSYKSGSFFFKKGQIYLDAVFDYSYGRKITKIIQYKDNKIHIFYKIFDKKEEDVDHPEWHCSMESFKQYIRSSAAKLQDN